MPLYKIFTLVLVGSIISSNAPAFEFSHPEYEFKANFPFHPSVTKVVQPLGNGLYSNTYMAKAVDNRAGRVFSANCNTSIRLARNITMTDPASVASKSAKTFKFSLPGGERKRVQLLSSSKVG